jgi:proline iminopeptidase
LLFEGWYDDATPSKIAAAWFKRVRAPGKKLVWFENAAHVVMIEEPGRFLGHLVEDARPYAGKQ